MTERLPRVVKIRQQFDCPRITDIEETVRRELQRVNLGQQIRPGMKIAVTAGSRGICDIPVIIRSVVRELKRYGAEPQIIPTMGSHGGATASGQQQVLASLGITEAFCEAPIVSSMDVVEIAKTKDGMPVYIDKQAWSCGGILVVGRVKLHTDFKAPAGSVESGLMKMCAIGLGKHRQAMLLHAHGIPGLRDKMPEVAKVVLKTANILCGLAILENAHDEIAKIEAVETAQIPFREPELLQESTSLMPRLPVNEVDVLVVDEIGKNYSGTGMDTNVLGRLRIVGVQEPDSPRIKYVFARDLSEASHGNALGIGLADVTTQRLLRKIDFDVMNENVITSSFLHRAMIPIALPNDKQAILASMRGLWGVPPERVRLLRIRNTLQLDELYASEALLPELRQMEHIAVEGALEPMRFDENGDLTGF